MALPKFKGVKKLVATDVIVGADGKPDQTFMRGYNDNLDNIRRVINGLTEQVDLITQALELAGIALDTAEALAKKDALTNSFVDPTAVLEAATSATDPTKAQITVANHTRKYGDDTSVAVTGGLLDLLNFGTLYYVYYDDPARNGGAVTYAVSTDVIVAAMTGVRHLVGSVITPTLSGDPPVGGGGPRPPGAGGHYPREIEAL